MGMEPTKKSADDLYREKVLQARKMSPEEKFLAGLRMFDEECRLRREKIREQFPEATAEEVEHILNERLTAEREQEERQGPVPPLLP